MTINQIDTPSLKTSFLYFLIRSIWCLSLLLDFSLTVKAATLILISGRDSAISSSKEGKSGFIYNLEKS